MKKILLALRNIGAITFLVVVLGWLGYVAYWAVKGAPEGAGEVLSLASAVVVLALCAGHWLFIGDGEEK